MSNIEIKELSEISSKNGNSTYRLNLNGQKEGLLGKRKAGQTFGGHYHEGISKSKSPETLYLLEGVIELRYRPLNEEQETTTIIRAPKQIQIPIKIWHQLYAITNVVFVELNSLEEHISDTKYLD